MILFTGLLVSSCGIILSPFIHFKDLPFPTGDYSIGTKIYSWEDQNRKEWFTTDPNDNRKIVVQIWYPASEKSDSLYPYMDYQNLRIESIANRIGKSKAFIKKFFFFVIFIK